MILNKRGVKDSDIGKKEADPEQFLLEANQSAMLAFVVSAENAPGSVTQADIQQLRDYGWEDRDMVDALAQGVSMIDHAIMMEAFQFDQNGLVD